MPKAKAGEALLVATPKLTNLDAAETAVVLSSSEVEAVQIQRPPLEEMAYAGLVRALVASTPFMSDFSRADPEIAFNKLVDYILGPGTFTVERRAFIRDLLTIDAFGRALVSGPRLLVSVRNWFAPGDLVWHVDRSRRHTALRILWPLGRAEGMRITRRSNIDLNLYTAYMRREHPLLCRLDREVARTGFGLEKLWAHRPVQVAEITSGIYSFIRNSSCVWELERDSIGIHRVETPVSPGTFHRSAWANRTSPGLQIILTATSS